MFVSVRIDLKYHLNKPNYFLTYVDINPVVELSLFLFCGYIGWNQLIYLVALTSKKTLLYT